MNIGGKCILKKNVEALEQAAQGGGGLIDPGSVQEMCKYGTEARWLVG